MAAVDSFAFRLAIVGHFPDTLYLSPEPFEPFVALTSLLVRNFPEYAPYRGEFDAIVPHLTIARVDERVQAAIEQKVLVGLPQDGVTCQCRDLALIENSSGGWCEVDVFELRV